MIILYTILYQTLAIKTTNIGPKDGLIKQAGFTVHNYVYNYDAMQVISWQGVTISETCVLGRMYMAMAFVGCKIKSYCQGRIQNFGKG